MALLENKSRNPTRNLSPLLANIYRHEFDMELEERGLRFTYFTADVIMYIKSETAVN